MTGKLQVVKCSIFFGAEIWKAREPKESDCDMEVLIVECTESA